MNTLKNILLAALVLSASAASAAVNRDGSTETPQHIYDRCGIVLSNPNSVVAANNAPCALVAVQAMMEPREQPANDK